MGFEGGRYRGDRTSTGTLIFYAILMALPLVIWGLLDYKVTLNLTQNCTGHLLRASHSNTIDTAKQELEAAVTYLENNHMQEGYTTIFESLRTPDEDIGFWYQNLKASVDQLSKMPKEVSPLERSNVLIKLRETLTHSDKGGDHVVCPPGLARYPNNATWVTMLILAGLSGLGCFIMACYIFGRD